MAEVNNNEAECLMACEDEDEKMSTYQEIITSKHKDEWKKAMDEEIKSIQDLDTWELVPRPTDNKENKKPDIEHMRIFGSIGYAHIPKQKRKKLYKI